MDGVAGPGGLQLVQSALQRDLSLVATYGEAHTDTWAGVWFEHDPAMHIVAAFTGDVAQHEAALRPRLRHPDRLVVQPRPHSLSDLRQIRQEIERTAQCRAAATGRPILTSLGLAKAVVRVALRADQEDLAGELAARYGSAVSLRVGVFSFPDRRLRRRPGAGVPALVEQAIDGLAMNVELDQAVIGVGDDGHGRVVLRNIGTERIGPLDTGQPLVGTLLNGARERVGGFAGWVAGMGLTVDLAPGESAGIRLIFGTASTREELGYALPPGRYLLKVQVRIHGADGPAHALTAPLTPITIAPS
ncbi:MAG: hypothetical protein ACRDNS_03710 [Trebonia sp.]